MGLFDFRKKKAPDPEPAPAYEPKPTDTVGVTTTANLTEKAVKIEVADDDEGTLVKGVYIWEDEGVIRGLKGEEIIFEVTKRSKAYQELEHLARKKAAYIVLKKCHGDYGVYYRLKVKTEATREEVGL